MHRSVGPWHRQSKKAWYVCHNGKQVNLKVRGEANEAQAVKAWHRLMAEDELHQKHQEQLQKPARKPQTQQTVQLPNLPTLKPQSLPVLVKAFLAEAEASALSRLD
jgi:hypothetical protein